MIHANRETEHTVHCRCSRCVLTEASLEQVNTRGFLRCLLNGGKVLQRGEHNNRSVLLEMSLVLGEAWISYENLFKEQMGQMTHLGPGLLVYRAPQHGTLVVFRFSLLPKGVLFTMLHFSKGLCCGPMNSVYPGVHCPYPLC